MHSKYLNTWLATLIAAFLVLVLPACWYGALARAQVLNLQAPSSANTNEEREEHEEHEEHEVAAIGNRPPPDSTETATRTTVSRVAATTPTPSILVASVAPVPHPAQFSIRRLR